MFNINDTVSYSTTGVCKIVDIRKQKFGNKEIEYYILQPSFQKAATVYVPVNNEELVSKMKPVISAAEIHKLIRIMPDITEEWIDDDNQRAEKFRQIIHSGDRHALVKLIKSIYDHNKQLIENGKKLRRNDETAMQEAETLLYNEFALVLKIKPDQVLPLIMNELDEAQI